MGKLIESRTLFIPGANGIKESELIRVYHDNKLDDFYALVPAHLSQYLTGDMGQELIGKARRGQKATRKEATHGYIRGDRASKVFEEIKWRAYKYERALTRKRKVIAYRFTEDEEMPFEHGRGIIIEWYVCWEVKKPGGNPGRAKYDLWIYEPPTGTGTVVCNNAPPFGCSDDNVKLMDWTEDREKFFASVYDGIQKMKDRVKSVLGGSPKKLALNIDTGGAFLLTGPKKSESEVT